MITHQFLCGAPAVMIAMALACNPQILTDDDLPPLWMSPFNLDCRSGETAARRIQHVDHSITHDLGVVAEVNGCRDVRRIYHRRSAVRVVCNPLHPYTMGLIGSLPRLDTEERYRLTAIQGNPPMLYEKPMICPFAPRCQFSFDKSWEANPPLMEVSLGHKVACWWDVREGKPRYA
jgi:oligopeptide/dipeptide ABC transporter ATP-binding protein